MEPEYIETENNSFSSSLYYNYMKSPSRCIELSDSLILYTPEYREFAECFSEPREFRARRYDEEDAFASETHLYSYTSAFDDSTPDVFSLEDTILKERGHDFTLSDLFGFASIEQKEEEMCISTPVLIQNKLEAFATGGMHPCQGNEEKVRPFLYANKRYFLCKDTDESKQSIQTLPDVRACAATQHPIKKLDLNKEKFDSLAKKCCTNSIACICKTQCSTGANSPILTNITRSNSEVSLTSENFRIEKAPYATKQKCAYETPSAYTIEKEDDWTNPVVDIRHQNRLLEPYAGHTHKNQRRAPFSSMILEDADIQLVGKNAYVLDNRRLQSTTRLAECADLQYSGYLDKTESYDRLCTNSKNFKTFYDERKNIQHNSVEEYNDNDTNCLKGASQKRATDCSEAALPFPKQPTGCTSIETSFLSGTQFIRECSLHTAVQDIAELSFLPFSTEDTIQSIQKLKMFECNNTSPSHDKKNCFFYHSLRDKRRNPKLYEAKPCSYQFDANYSSEGKMLCLFGDLCDKCHNRQELLYHPDIYMKRFCSSYNKAVCPRGLLCAFAHSREEIRCELYSVEEERLVSADFYMLRFKTLWCPFGTQHDWHHCPYAHTYQDSRRTPLLGYISTPCRYWEKEMHLAEYKSRCPFGLQCSHSHGSKEQLYHPLYYKTMPCTDFKKKGICPRQNLCAFYHDGKERRYPRINASAQVELTEHAMISKKAIKKLLQPNFLNPSLFAIDITDTQEDVAGYTKNNHYKFSFSSSFH